MKTVLVFALLAMGWQKNPFMQDINPEGLAKIIATHPSPLVKVSLAGWIKEGKVKLDEKSVGGLYSSAETDSGAKEQVYLWYQKQVPVMMFNDKEQLQLLQLDLYHEAAKIREHISGRHKLPPFIGIKGETSKAKARRIWSSEWAVFPGEWELAKKMGARQLRPIVNETVGNNETPALLLEAFYKLRMNEAANDRVLAADFAAIYQQEKAKLAGHP